MSYKIQEYRRRDVTFAKLTGPGMSGWELDMVKSMLPDHLRDVIVRVCSKAYHAGKQAQQAKIREELGL